VTAVDAAIEALREGGLAIVPTDTVYGLVGRGDSEEVARALYAAKGRDAEQPTALLFASLDVAVGRLPELTPETLDVASALLPGPVTLVVPNPGRRFAWLSPGGRETLGIRVPAVDGPGRVVLDALGVLVGTSANLPGGPDPCRVGDVPARLRDAVAAVVDGGELPGRPSTVIDTTGDEPRVLREGALAAGEALARVRAARDA
jgi:L-threonylcarbamoyladenylate synthase